MSSIAYVGVDAHASSLVICALGTSSNDPLVRTTLTNDKLTVKKWFAKFSNKYDLRVCYEASSCGFVLHRWLVEMGIGCIVIAPSLVAKKAGDRVKTDRRDAERLARGLRNGDLTAVRVPTAEEEADRGLVRLRGSVCRDVVQSKNQVLKFLSTRGRYYRPEAGSKKKKLSNWTLKHWAWLRGLEFSGSDQIVWGQLIAILEEKIARLSALDAYVVQLAQSDRYKEAVGKLCCLRGVATLTAMILITEIGDFARFGSPRQLMSYLGLVPSESSSGDTRRQGGITKTGNARGRHVLVEAAWKYRNKVATSALLKARREGQPEDIIAHANKAQHRLHGKYWSIANRKDLRKAAVAVARELAGFVWAIMTGHCSASSVQSGTVATA